MSQLFAGGNAPGLPTDVSPSIGRRLTDISGVGDARRLAVSLGKRAELGEVECSNLGIIVSELATNAVRHAGGGELVLRVLRDGERSGIEVLCLDRGPGLANVAESFRDGFSTTGTMGTGLGAARRLAHHFDIYSAPAKGTVVVARVWSGGGAGASDGMITAGVALPVAGETVSGDGWAAVSTGTRTVIVLVDGLGHGSIAAEATAAALRLFQAHATRSPREIMTLLHQGLQATRGAAAAVAEIDAAAGELRYAGLGNIAGRIVASATAQSLVSHNGIVGHQARSVRELTYPWPADAMLVLHSDGITNHWKPETYPGLFRRDPALAAGILYRDYARERDDSAVVACRYRRHG